MDLFTCQPRLERQRFWQFQLKPDNFATGRCELVQAVAKAACHLFIDLVLNDSNLPPATIDCLDRLPTPPPLFDVPRHESSLLPCTLDDRRHLEAQLPVRRSLGPVCHRLQHSAKPTASGSNRGERLIFILV